ncbi:hypothetical protein L484_025065 [Morus notabilis]|uniref:Uncharacterized protein n=1 Tax=Morus notabilis TaxID=981085 RepID=W9QKS4_9ROSA|nr:hypothetical protein L484_025065 [Morus notabilis]
MARKRKSSGNKDNMPEEKEVEPRSSHSSERVEEQSDCANPLTEKVDALVEKVNSQPSKEANTTKSYSRKKKMKYQVAIVRRSGPINNTVVTAQNQDIELVTKVPNNWYQRIDLGRHATSTLLVETISHFGWRVGPNSAN